MGNGAGKTEREDNFIDDNETIALLEDFDSDEYENEGDMEEPRQPHFVEINPMMTVVNQQDVLSFEVDNLEDDLRDRASKRKLNGRMNIAKNETLRNYNRVLAASLARKPVYAGKGGDRTNLVGSLELMDESDEEGGSVIDCGYSMDELKKQFFENAPADHRELDALLWENKNRIHNWMKLTEPEDVNVDDEDFNYGEMEKELLAEYQEKVGENDKSAKGTISRNELEEMRKKLLHAQNERIRFLKEQAKLLDIRIKHRIKDLKKLKNKAKKNQKKKKKNLPKRLTTSTKNILRRKSRRKMSKFGNMSFSSARKQSATSVKSTSSTNLSKSSIPKTEVETSSMKIGAEINQLKLLRKQLATDGHFPGLLRWKIKAEVTNGLHIGAKDIEVASITADFSVTAGTDVKTEAKTVTVEVNNLVARIGILELALKGTNSFAAMLGGMLNPTIARLYLILKGSFKVVATYDEVKMKWVLSPKQNVFKLHIQKQVKGVRKIVLPTTLINVLGKIVFPKLIANGIRDSLPQKSEPFDDNFTERLKEMLRTLGFANEVIYSLLPKEKPFLVDPNTHISLSGSFKAEGDLDFNVWRTPLIAPTRYAVAARKALKFKTAEDAVQLDILLRSRRAEKAGFNTKESVSLEKLAAWRLKFGSYELKDLKPLIQQICMGDDMDAFDAPSLVQPEVLFHIFERVEKLSQKPVDFTISIDKIEVKADIVQIYENIQQMRAADTTLHARSRADAEKASVEIMIGLEALFQYIRLKGEILGTLSAVMVGPLKSKIEQVDKAAIARGRGDDTGALMVKIQDIQFNTNFKTFQEAGAVAKLAEEMYPPLTVSAVKRNDDSKEYIAKWQVKNESKMIRRESGRVRSNKRGEKLRNLVKLAGTKKRKKVHKIPGTAEIGVVGAKIDLFPQNGAFGAVEAQIEQAQLYVDNCFWNTWIDYPQIVSYERFPHAKLFLQESVAPMLQKRGFTKLAAIGGSKSKDILSQAEGLLHELDGMKGPHEASFSAQTTERHPEGPDTSKYELQNLAGFLQDAHCEFVGQAKSIPVKVASDGVRLVITLNKSYEMGDPFGLQLKVRRNLSDLLSRE